MQRFLVSMSSFLSELHIPNLIWTDILEILIISFLLYHIMLWIKNTRAWMLMKGIVVIAAFVAFAALFNMDTILWIVQNIIGIAATAVIVVLQPELRKALEELGRKNILSSIIPFETAKEGTGLFSDRTVNEIVKACIEMGRARTGALIVIENEQSLSEYERTGIEVDAIVSSQLLINIFEHNTPLHDGAVTIRKDRVTAATCYLPLTDSMNISKELGTRHRAGVGVSEVTDSLVIIVSEETGRISAAYQGGLERNLDGDKLRERLTKFQNKKMDEKKRITWKGKAKSEKAK